MLSQTTRKSSGWIWFEFGHGACLMTLTVASSFWRSFFGCFKKIHSFSNTNDELKNPLFLVTLMISIFFDLNYYQYMYRKKTLPCVFWTDLGVYFDFASVGVLSWPRRHACRHFRPMSEVHRRSRPKLLRQVQHRPTETIQSELKQNVSYLFTSL